MPADRSITRRKAPTLTDDIFSPDKDDFAPDELPVLSEDPAMRVATAMLRRAIAASPPCPAWCSIHVVTTPSSAWTQVLSEAWEEMVRAAASSGSKAENGAWWRRGCWVNFVHQADLKGRMDNGDAAVGKALAERKLLVGFAHDTGLLPRDLTDAADWHLAVTAPTPADIPCGVPVPCGRGVTSIGLSAEDAAAVTPRLLRLATRPNQNAMAWFAKLRDLLAKEPGRAREAAVAPRAAPTLARLHGMPEATEWGMALARDLSEYRRGALPWSAVDAGCLLSGPPGVGKTLFARALAASCDVPLFTGSYATWHSSGSTYQGDFLKAMRRTFADAKAAAPCILFIDEVDSFPDRRKVSNHNGSYETQVVNGLLAEIDGADARDGVVLLAACNHPEKLDPALVRSGRLDRHIRLALPSASDLTAILREHLREHLGDDLRDEDLRRMGSLAAGRSGADCERAVRGARRRARLRSEPMVLADLVAELVDATMDAASAFRVATHEAGHVVAALELGGTFVLEAVTIQATGGMKGAMLGRWNDIFLSEDHVNDRLVVLLAGRAAEEVVLGNASSGAGGGAASDLAQATGLALRASVSMGLDRDDGLLWRGEPDDRMAPAMLECDPRLAARIRLKLSGAHEQASDLVRRRRAAVAAVADALVEFRTLSGDEARNIVRRYPGPECRA